MKLSRISRVVQLLCVLQSGQCYCPDDLMKVLGVSRRTVFRDLQELGAIGVPYYFDSEAGGYRIDPDFFLPPIDLTLQEALSLLMLVHKGRSHLPGALKRSALLGGLRSRITCQWKSNITVPQHWSTSPSSRVPIRRWGLWIMFSGGYRKPWRENKRCDLSICRFLRAKKS